MRIYRFFIFSVAFLFLFSSCAVPHYTHTYEATKGLDLRTGKWLVNTIHGDLSYPEQVSLTKKLMNKLQKTIHGDVVYVDSVSLKYILPSQMPFELPEETLEKLKTTTDFDYVVSVWVNPIMEQLGSVSIPPHYDKLETQTEVYLDVYEVKSGERIYSQRVVASAANGGHGEGGVVFSKSAFGLITSSLNRAVNDIKKHSVRP